MRLSATEIARMLDVSVVQTHHSLEDIKKAVELAKGKRVMAIHVLPNWVKLAREMMGVGGDTIVGSSVGFPSGGSTTETKLFEAKQLIADGVQEIDMMLNVGRLKSGQYDYVENEIKAIAEISGDMTLKVILETCYLTDDEIKKGCELCIKAGADYVKTSTGWAEKGATVEVIAMITEYTAGTIKVKASGGIQNLKTLMKFYEMGISRFGVNYESTKKIFDECKQTHD